jgi:hypothetical protein
MFAVKRAKNVLGSAEAKNPYVTELSASSISLWALLCLLLCVAWKAIFSLVEKKLFRSILLNRLVCNMRNHSKKRLIKSEPGICK